ncbi:MAG: ATP-binding cassette domain-containing protein [Proteobacteria bacterium]|nr:ATP-binding cassette domain-containing protein [Pseudomonadota bacterium]
MIELDSLTKRFGTIEAVRGISLIAPDGCVTGLLGANGAGKSTTLRLLYGVQRPDSGRALVDGIDVASQPRLALARLGVLPHNAGLYPHLTARENIRYYGQLQGMSGVALERRIDALADMLELGALLERRTKGFSQGERIKVALARALVHEPQNLVLDEPTNGLDVLATRNLRALILRLRDAGHCIMFTSHVMQEVAALCDEIAIISGGRVVARGTPAALARGVPSGTLEDAFVAALTEGASP